MIWALDDAGRRARRGRRAAATPRRRSPRCSALCNDARVPVTAAAGRSGVCGASVPGVRRRAARPHRRSAGIVDVDHDVDARRRAARHVRRRVRGRAPRRARRHLGHWPQSMALSTVGGWLACRGAGQLSTRYGKIEDIVTGLDVVLADGTARHTGGAPRAAVGPDLTQLFVGSEGTLGIIVGARLRAAPAPAAEIARRVRVHVVRRRRSTRCAASCSAARRPRCSGSTTRSRPTAATRPATRTCCSSLDEGDAAHRRRDHARSSPRSARPPTPLDVGARRAVAGAPQRRVRARGADPARLRRRHDGDLRAVARAAATIYERATAAIRARRAHAGRVGAPEPLLPRRRAASTSRSRASRPPTSASAYYRAVVGRRATRGARSTAARSATTTASASTAPASCATRSAPGFDVLAVGEGGARPERHPQPGQARPAHPVRRAPLAVSTHDRVLVVDVGTSSVRAAVVRADGTHRARASSASCCPTRPPTGIVEFDATVMARTTPRPRHRRARRGRPGRRGRHLQPTRRRRSCGTARHGEPIGPGHRLAGPPHDRRVPRAARATASASRPNQSATKVQWLLDQLDPDRGRDLCFGTVDTWVTWTLSNGRVHVTDATNAAVTGTAAHERSRRLGPDGPRPARHPRAMLPTIVDSTRRRRRRRPRCPARRRSPRSLGDQQASLVGQGCVRPGDAKITFGTGGMLDLVLGDDAARVRRTGRARHVPDRRVAARRAATRGASRRSCSPPAPTCSGCATTSASSRARDESHDVAASVRRHRRRRVRARAARPRHARVGLRRARRAVRADARHRPRRDRARGARRHRAPRRRPRRRGRSRHRHRDPARCASTAA